ncbi:MAG: hypothetical protein EA396_08725 [Anaerolineaceae bacterium]|nr:MAG: hypothetical protein EA396_08725 [Anaerolineaceae bacterium]
MNRENGSMTINARPSPPIRAARRQPSGTLERWRYTLSNALIITRREVRDSLRDWRIIAPIIVLTFIFPLLSQFVAVQFREYLGGFGGNAMLIGERSTPFLLMVVGFFPISISLVIALETFVGEKERRSLEPLLSTPLSTTELYIGKTLAAMIPPLGTSLIAMGFYMLITLTGSLEWRPQPMLIFQIFLLTIVQALVMVTGAVVVSSQTTSTRAANLLASFIILPMAMVVIIESVIMFSAPDAESARGITALWGIIVGMAIVAVLFLRLGSSIFNREELLSSTVDQLDLRGTFAKIGRYVVAVDDDGTPARNLIDWYRRAIPDGLRRIRASIAFSLFVLTLAMIVGAIASGQEPYNITLPPQDELVAERPDDQSTRLVYNSVGSSPAGELISFDFIIRQNLTVIALVFVAGMFSFGVVALSIVILTFGLLGYVTGLVLSNGYSPMFLVLGILPHGVIELPVILIATGTAVAMGACIMRPPAGKTVGHTWLVQLGVSLRLIIGVIVPGLIIAALIEATITPYLLFNYLAG